MNKLIIVGAIVAVLLVLLIGIWYVVSTQQAQAEADAQAAAADKAAADAVAAKAESDRLTAQAAASKTTADAAAAQQAQAASLLAVEQAAAAQQTASQVAQQSTAPTSGTLKTSSGIPGTFNNGWAFFQGYDSDGNDLGNSGLYDNVPALQNWCKTNSGCAGFNTNAWMKHTVSPSNQWLRWTDEPNKGWYMPYTGQQIAERYSNRRF